MRAIANGQLDGFPPKDELRTVYVEHDIDASEAETPVVEYVYADPLLQGASLLVPNELQTPASALLQAPTSALLPPHALCTAAAAAPCCFTMIAAPVPRWLSIPLQTDCGIVHLQMPATPRTARSRRCSPASASAPRCSRRPLPRCLAAGR